MRESPAASIHALVYFPRPPPMDVSSIGDRISDYRRARGLRFDLELAGRSV